MWNFFAEFTRNQLKIKSSVDKAFGGQDRVILKYKAASVELKREKTPVWRREYTKKSGSRIVVSTRKNICKKST